MTKLMREAILRDRKPCAFSEMTLRDGRQVGNAEIYATPLGTVIKAAFFALSSVKDDYETFNLEIDGRRDACDRAAAYRVRTANLPPIFIKMGKGNFLFTTDRFSAADLIGRRLLLKSGGVSVAEGRINDALETHKIF